MARLQLMLRNYLSRHLRADDPIREFSNHDLSGLQCRARIHLGRLIKYVGRRTTLAFQSAEGEVRRHQLHRNQPRLAVI